MVHDRKVRGRGARFGRALWMALCVSSFCGCGAAHDVSTTPAGAGGSDAPSAGSAGQASNATGGRGGSSGVAGYSAYAGAVSSPEAAGEAGEAGAGSIGSAGAKDGCSLADIANCDDHDPCTTDAVDAACVCSHSQLTDGTSCDDGDSCTLSDVCSAGHCAGVASTSQPSVTGSLQSFGDGPGLQTLVAFASPNRVIFARDRHLTLLGLDGNVASPLDDVATSSPVRSDSVSSMVWVSRPRTFVIPVLDHFVAVASIDRGIDLFDLTGDHITPSETYGFGTGGWQIVSVTGAGSRLYACTAYQVQTWTIDPASQEIAPGPQLPLAAGHHCQGLALAPDGQTLYAATSVGLEQISIASDGKLAIVTEARQGNLVVDVRASADAVAIFEIKQVTSGFGDVVVLHRDDLQEMTSFKADLSDGGTRPIGFALLDGDRLLLQTVHADSAACAVQEAVTLSLSSTPLELDRRSTFHACQSPFLTPSFNTVASGSLAVLEPMHQLIQVGAADGKMQLVSAPQQGSFERVRAAGPNSVRLYAAGSTQLVDIANATLPRVQAGGLTLPIVSERLRFDLSDPNAVSLLTVSDPVSGGANGPVGTVLRADADGLPSVFGSIANDDADGPWTAAGSALYQISASGSTSFRLRRFRATSVSAQSGQTLRPELDATLQTAAPAELDYRMAPFIEADAESGEVAVLEPRANSTASGSDTPVLSRYSLGAQAAPLFSEALEPGVATDLAISPSGCVVLSSSALSAVDRTGARKAIPLNDGSGLVVEKILSLDDRKLLLAVSFDIDPSKRSEGVLVLRADDFSELARYPLAEPALSFAAVGAHWAFGSRSSLSVVTPPCGAATPP